MRVCVHSAIFGNFDVPKEHELQQGVDADRCLLTDDNFPSRAHCMGNRLRARIPKMFGWDIWPGYDYYLWLDGSIRLSQPDSVRWFLDKLSDGDFAVFKHPVRNTIAEEADYLRTKLKAGSHYINSRYGGEDLDGQLRAIEQNDSYADTRLFATGAFMYRPSPAVTKALTDWWVHTSRFHVIDQLAFPYVIRGCSVRVIDEDIYHASHIQWVKHAKS